MSLDKVAYRIKQRCPGLFKVIEFSAGYFVYFLNRRSIRRALTHATIHGEIHKQPAQIRPLRIDDLDQLLSFFATLPESHFTYFRPHGFSRSDIIKVLTRPYYLKYGLFVNDILIGYCLTKLYPGKVGFIGRIISTDYAGFGLGKFFSKYLQWQCYLLRFKMRSTISSNNLPSLGSHKSAGGFTFLASLPNGYTLIEFPRENMPKQPPALSI